MRRVTRDVREVRERKGESEREREREGEEERGQDLLWGEKKETRRAREIFPRCGIKGAADYYGGNYRAHCVSGPGPRFAIESEQVGNAVLAVCAGPAGSLTDRPRLSTRLACRPRSTYGSSQVSLSPFLSRFRLSTRARVRFFFLNRRKTMIERVRGH